MSEKWKSFWLIRAMENDGDVFSLIFSPQQRAKADISTLVKADVFILGRHLPILFSVATCVYLTAAGTIVSRVHRAFSLKSKNEQKDSRRSNQSPR